MTIQVPQIRHNCAKCGGTLSGRRMFFCSDKCALDARKGFRTTRKDALVRDNDTCQCCGVTLSKMEVHHICPLYARSEDGNLLVNLITVCESCHDDIHGFYTFAEIQAIRKGITTINYSEVLEDAIMTIQRKLRITPSKAK